MQQAVRVFIDLLPVMVIFGVVAVPVTWVLVHRRRRDTGEPVSVASATVGVRVLAAVTVLTVFAITLLPVGGFGAVQTSTNWVPFASIVELATSSVDASVALRNIVLNVLLFVPVGVVGALIAAQLGRTWIEAIVPGAVLSLTVEAAQLLLPLGRAVDVDDVMLNAVGVLLGTGAIGLARRLLAASLGRPAHEHGVPPPR